MDDKKKKIIFFSAFGGAVVLLVIILLIVLLSGGEKKPVSGSSDGGTSSQSSDSAMSEDGSGEGDSTQPGETDSNTDPASTTAAVSTGSSKTQSPNHQVTTTTKKEGNTVSPTQKYDSSKYNLYTYSARYWLGDTVYNESVYPLTTATGSNQTVQLMYDATSIVEVRSSDLKTIYKAGKDYKLENGKLVIPAGSAIKVNKYENYYLKTPLADHSQKGPNGGYIYFSEGDVFHKSQIAVTYKHQAQWGGPVPAKKGSKLPNLQRAIKNKEAVNIVYFGDSISCGANASSTVGAAPMTPKWTEMFSASLEEMGTPVTDYNLSVGGQISIYGVQNISKVNRCAPDLVVLGWGMNDGSLWNNVSPDSYKTNIKAMIVQLRKSLPDSEIILIGTILPNPEAIEFVGPHEQYTAKLYELEKEFSSVAVADMTQFHKYLLTRKNFRDMTGNNVNHPNDFLSRMYVQVLLETISK